MVCCSLQVLPSLTSKGIEEEGIFLGDVLQAFATWWKADCKAHVGFFFNLKTWKNLFVFLYSTQQQSIKREHGLDHRPANLCPLI